MAGGYLMRCGSSLLQRCGLCRSVSSFSISANILIIWGDYNSKIRFIALQIISLADVEWIRFRRISAGEISPVFSAKQCFFSPRPP